MRTVSSDELTDDDIRDMAAALDGGGLVCLPVNGSYRIFADVMNEDAVMKLIQSKRRVEKAPSLVFIASEKMLNRVVADVEPAAKAIYGAMWPGPVTMRFDVNDSLPRKVARELVKATGKVGVRVPEDETVRTVVRTLGRPVYVSSANRANKPGESSRAQVRQNFGRGVAFFVDDGDLSEGKSSTVVEVSDGQIDVVRSGAVTDDELQALVDAAPGRGS